MSGTQHCTKFENKTFENNLMEYLDGRAKPSERRAVEDHLSACAGCRTRAEEFRMISEVLDELPVFSPSAAFDATLRARIAAEPARRIFLLWSWLPSPRLAFAVAALVCMSVWLSSMPRVAPNQPLATQMSADADFGMIRDLPVLENYDLLSKFDALSELPAPASVAQGEVRKETR